MYVLYNFVKLKFQTGGFILQGLKTKNVYLERLKKNMAIKKYYLLSMISFAILKKVKITTSRKMIEAPDGILR
jgi:hypothetical protein